MNLHLLVVFHCILKNGLLKGEGENSSNNKSGENYEEDPIELFSDFDQITPDFVDSKVHDEISISAFTPTIFLQPSLLQFPDYAYEQNDNDHDDYDEYGEYDNDPTDMMMNDEQYNLTDNNRDRANLANKIVKDKKKKSRKKKPDDCIPKKNGKSIKYGTSPRFKKPVDEMQQLVAGWLGHRIELSCPYKRSCPRAHVQWIKNGVIVQASKEKTGRSFIDFKRKGEILTIEDNRSDDDGLYTCKISNKFGSISHTIKVTSVPRFVAAPPQILDGQPGNHTVVVGANFSLFCQPKIIDSSSPHNIVWYRHFQVNGSYVNKETDKVHIVALQRSEENPPDDAELVLNDISKEDEGFYSCRVKNQFDGLVSTGYLTVIDPLPPPVPPAPDTSVPPFYMYLAVGVGGGCGLILLIVVVLLCFKYKQEKKKKLFAVENAQCVARWTKKIIIERSFSTDSNPEELLTPVVRVEKVMATDPSLPNIDLPEEQELFEFQIDEAWEFSRDCLELADELGQGAFGKVVKAYVHGARVKSELNSPFGCHLVEEPTSFSTITVAVKMTKENCSEQEVLDLVKEIEIMKAVGGHINIVNLLGACTQPTGKPLLAILEYAEHGNLRDYLRMRRGLGHHSQDLLETISPDPVGLKEMLSFAWQVARGMEFLSNRRCVHRDLAARNILIAHGGVAKVADFGLARDVEQTDYYRKVTEGKLPVLWMSPESLFDGVSTTKSDVWSFGVLLWEIVTCGERPYAGVATEALLDLIKGGYRMSIPLECPQDLYLIMRMCWQIKPESRPTWSQLVDHLLSQYHNTLPGVYLDLPLASIPTPPSSVDTTACSDDDAVATVYKTITSVVSGIAPLSKSDDLLHPVRKKRFSSCSSILLDLNESGTATNEDSEYVEYNRDSLESGYSSSDPTKNGGENDTAKIIYYNEICQRSSVPDLHTR